MLVVVTSPPQLLEVVLLGQDAPHQLRPVHLRLATELLGQPIAVVLQYGAGVFWRATLDELWKEKRLCQCGRCPGSISKPSTGLHLLTLYMLRKKNDMFTHSNFRK